MKANLQSLGSFVKLYAHYCKPTDNMTRWLSLCACLLLVHIPASIAFDIPYGVQDPMRSGKYQACEGHEIGFWQFYGEKQSDGKVVTFLYLPSVDVPNDPAYVICLVPPERKIMVLEVGKNL